MIQKIFAVLKHFLILYTLPMILIVYGNNGLSTQNLWGYIVGSGFIMYGRTWALVTTLLMAIYLLIVKIKQLKIRWYIEISIVAAAFVLTFFVGKLLAY